MTTEDRTGTHQNGSAPPTGQDGPSGNEAQPAENADSSPVAFSDTPADPKDYLPPPPGPDAEATPEPDDGPAGGEDGNAAAAPDPGDDDAKSNPDIERLDKARSELLEVASGLTADAYARLLQQLRSGGEIDADYVLREGPVEINREIECEIYAHRSMRLAGSPSSRTVLTLTFDGVRHARLSGLLGANLKGRVRINVIDLQAPIEEDDEANLPEAGVLRQAALPMTRNTPEDMIDRRDADHREAYSVDNIGNVYKAHGFAPADDDTAKCALCGMGEGHDLHAGKRRTTSKTAQRRKTETLLPHPWTPRESEDGPAGPQTCAYCDLPDDDPIHDRGEAEGSGDGADKGPDELPSFADRVTYWRDVEGIEESIAWHTAMDEVVKAETQPMTEADQLAAKLLYPDWDLSDALQRSVAEDLDKPLTDDELTDDQRDARRRLADKSGD